MLRSRIVAVAAVVALAPWACDGSDSPTQPRTIMAAGSYDATFSTVEVIGCEGFVPTGSTTGIVTVTQSNGQVTLELTDVTEFIDNDPRGSYDPETGAFSFEGIIVVSDEGATVNANGTIDGAFTEGGAMNLAFDFSAFTCNVQGTITGQRR